MVLEDGDDEVAGGDDRCINPPKEEQVGSEMAKLGRANWAKNWGKCIQLGDGPKCDMGQKNYEITQHFKTSKLGQILDLIGTKQKEWLNWTKTARLG